jgi:hypothetical protein
MNNDKTTFQRNVVRRTKLLLLGLHRQSVTLRRTITTYREIGGCTCSPCSLLSTAGTKVGCIVTVVGPPKRLKSCRVVALVVATIPPGKSASVSTNNDANYSDGPKREAVKSGSRRLPFTLSPASQVVKSAAGCLDSDVFTK